MRVALNELRTHVMRIVLNEMRDHVVLSGEVPPPVGVSGKPGWYRVELSRSQAMELAGRLYSLASEMDLPGKTYAPTGG